MAAYAWADSWATTESKYPQQHVVYVKLEEPLH